MRDFVSLADEFDRDGVLVVRDLLQADDLALLEQVFDERLKDNATTAPLYPGDNSILQSHGMSINDPTVARLIRESPIADVAWGLFRQHEVWYWTEQAWLKQGGYAPRTPWHQDTAYIPFAGPSFAILWIPLDSLPAENVLEVVRGSHRGTLYNGTTFERGNDTAPLFDERDRPRLPDIEAERECWDIFSTDLNRGDILVLHPGCLHGGAPTYPGQRRRAMSFRFFSNDVVYQPMPRFRGEELAHTQEERKDKLVPGMDKLAPGDPIYRSGAYRCIRPWTTD